MPLNIDFQQICLHLLNFAILFTGLYLILYKPVKDFMNKRQEHYKDMEKKADDNKAEAEELKKSYEERIKVVSLGSPELAGGFLTPSTPLGFLGNWSYQPGAFQMAQWFKKKKKSACQCRRNRRFKFNPWVRKTTWRKK